MTLGVLAADVVQEGLRFVVCSAADPAAVPVVCVAPAGTVATLGAKIKALMVLWSAGAGAAEPPPAVESPPASHLERLRAAPGL
jgi:hypothetical protein